MKQLKVIQSAKNLPHWFMESCTVFKPDIDEREMNLVMVYHDIPFETIRGFGGSFTQSSAYNYHNMSQDLKNQFLSACFSPSGLNYNLGRTHIGSCDFSFGNFSYCDTAEDINLENFSISCDEDYLLPMILDACSFSSSPLSLMASPWSPPAWMKDNNSMAGGGKLLPRYYDVWANYLVRYIQEYRSRGVPINHITIQNEPKAVQRWESCIYSSIEEGNFIVNHLEPLLRKNGLNDIEIFIWDHNKERVFSRASEIFSIPGALDKIAGIAFHWYSGDHFENLQLCRKFFPNQDLFFTEGCVELAACNTTMAQRANSKASTSETPWEYGELYAHDIIGNLNNGTVGFIDWNLILDKTGGPNHVGNYCSAPILYNSDTDSIELQPSYCFIRHLSAFIPAGSRRIAHSSFNNEIMTFACRAQNNEVTVILLNTSEAVQTIYLKDVHMNSIAKIILPEKSITTVLYDTNY